MNTALEQILSLIQKTNDRCIVTDISGKNAYAIMSLQEYEKLIDQVNHQKVVEKPVQLAPEPPQELTDSNLLNKINRDIAIWRSVQESKVDTVKDEPIIEEPIKPDVISNNQFKKDISEIANLPIIDASGAPQEDSATDDSARYYFEPLEEDEQSS